jgi:hypothetical protein
MYGHELIDHLKNIKEHHPLFCIKDDLINKIRDSQHFYCGDEKEINDFIKDKFDGTPYFCGELGKFVKIPYNKCSFSFSSRKNEVYSKSILLVEEIDNKENIILIQVFIYEKRLNAWTTDGLYYKIKIIEKEIQSEISVLSHPSINYSPNVDDQLKSIEDTHDLMWSSTFGALNIFLLLLSCKNINKIKNNPPEKLNKKRITKGKQPLFTYHTLKMILPSERGESYNTDDIANNGGLVRIHLCRGHFKTYAVDNPLFGKYTGRYWWQPQVRGNKERGLVMKDYHLEKLDENAS